MGSRNVPAALFFYVEVIAVCRVILRKYFILMVLNTFLLSLGFPAEAGPVSSDTHTAAKFTDLIDNGGFAVEKNNRYIVTHNFHTLFVPASIIKIATCLAALDMLGPQFHFTTAFYHDSRNNLYIKGYGDPFLVSEEVLIIVRKLKELGWTEINNIYLDNSAFNLQRSADGSGTSDNPYDADNSALAVNFNTVNIEVRPDGRVVSAEPQTPTIKLMADLAEGLQPGVYRVNINRDSNSGEIITSRYVGELFRAFQIQENIAGTGIIAAKKIPEALEPIYIHSSSKSLQDMLAPLLLYSNNFIANQIFLALGSQKFGYPATWEKSSRVMSAIMENKFHLSPDEMIMIEGSGLSRKNRVTPHAMIQLLNDFKPYARLLPQKDGIYVKSGTLTGTYSYAGYFVENERLDSFALMLNQEHNNRDKVLEVLKKIYREN
jgi:serine-type D-Ala-D-Ala carboxypeptidase/endopeptidase (penicillin-binding protein 4)